MKLETLFEKTSLLKDKFTNLFIQKKKLKALENYSEVIEFRHENYLRLIRTCMSEGFLDDKEAAFLDHLLTKYEVNFLDWACKTKWLKQEMIRIAKENLDLTDTGPHSFRQFLYMQRAGLNIPTHIMNQNHSQTTRRY